MSAVRDNNFFVVHGWMINQLGLSGRELQTYAIIYGFSQADEQKFRGSLQYLADWLGSSRRNVLRWVQSLEEKGLLEKTDVYTNGVKTCEYRCITDSGGVVKMTTGCCQNDTGGVVKMTPGCCQNDTGGVVKMTHNNIPDIHTDNIPDKKDIGGQAPTPPQEKKSTKKPKADTEAILARYTTDPETLELLREWLKVRKAKRAPETEKALTLNLDKLDKLAQESGLSVPAYLEAVIARGWAAFFAIKDGQRPAGGGYQRPQPEHRPRQPQTSNPFLAAMQSEGVM